MSSPPRGRLLGAREQTEVVAKQRDAVKPIRPWARIAEPTEDRVDPTAEYFSTADAWPGELVDGLGHLHWWEQV